MLTADGPVLLECNARFGDPETQVILPRLAAPLGPLLLAAARGRLADAAQAARRSTGARLPAIARRGGRRRARGGRLSRTRRAAATRSRGSTPPRRPAALVFHAGTSRDERRRLPHGRRARPDGRRPRPGPRCRARRRPRRPPTLISFDGLQRRHDIGAEASSAGASRGAAAMIRRYTLAEMGAIWSETARFERDAPGRARRRARPGRARPDPGRGPRGDRDAAPRVDVERIAEIETHDRPRRHRVRQPGRRVGRAGGPLPPPRPDEQRRRRYGPRAPAPRRRGAPARRRATGSSPCSSPALGPRPTRR